MTDTSTPQPIAYNNTEYETYEEIEAATRPERRECICPESPQGEACLFVEGIEDFRLNESCLHCSQIDVYEPCPGDMEARA